MRDSLWIFPEWRVTNIIQQIDLAILEMRFHLLNNLFSRDLQVGFAVNYTQG